VRGQGWCTVRRSHPEIAEGLNMFGLGRATFGQASQAHQREHTPPVATNCLIAGGGWTEPPSAGKSEGPRESQGRLACSSLDTLLRILRLIYPFTLMATDPAQGFVK
jgi:hypothetical protein